MMTSFEIPPDRVREHTAPVVNTRIDRLSTAAADEAIRGGHDAIVRRLAELDREWDVDRALMANFAILGGASFAAGLGRYSGSRFRPGPRKGFLYFFGSQMGFLLMHAVTGWCPPASLFRRLGFRTKGEIEAERRHLLASLDGEAVMGH